MKGYTLSRRGLVRGTLAAACLVATGAPLAACSGAGHRAGMVLDGSIEDGGWGESCHAALVAAAGAHRWEVSVRENVGADGWADAIEGLIGEGCDIVFAPGAQYRDAAVEAAAAHPEASFIILNGDAEAENIENLAPDNAQIGLIAGALAGLMTESGAIGFIGGTELAGTREKAAAFEEAARAVRGDVDVAVAYAGSFTDADRGFELARQMVEERGVDVLFGDASAVDAGAREALGELGRGAAIAQPGDAGGAYDRVVAASVVTDTEAMLRGALRDVEAGEFGGATITGDLANGGVRVGTISEALVSPYVRERFLGIVDQIEQGSFPSS